MPARVCLCAACIGNSKIMHAIVISFLNLVLHNWDLCIKNYTFSGYDINKPLTKKS